MVRPGWRLAPARGQWLWGRRAAEGRCRRDQERWQHQSQSRTKEPTQRDKRPPSLIGGGAVCPLTPGAGQATSGHRESILGNTVQSVVALLSNLVTCKDSNMKLLCEHGLVHHVCNLFTAAATLCLDVDDKPSTEVAATLLFSLLDILHGMLTYMSGVVRLALQAQKSSSGGDTQAAEDLLLLGKPLTALAGLLIPLLPGEDPEVFEVSSKCLSILVQLYGGAVPDSLCPENAESFARVLASRKDPKDQKLLLRTLRRMVTSSEQHRVRLEQAGTLQWVLERLAQAEGSPDKGVVASLALDILRSLGSLQEGT